jgi:hypothetical protein
LRIIILTGVRWYLIVFWLAFSWWLVIMSIFFIYRWIFCVFFWEPFIRVFVHF